MIAEHGLDAEYPLLPVELCQGIYPIKVVDVFCVYFSSHSHHSHQLSLANYSMNAELAEGDQGIAAVLVCQGLIPCAPLSPTLAFST